MTTNPGWAYSPSTNARIKTFARKGVKFTWSDATYDPKAERVAYVPARPEPNLSLVQRCQVWDNETRLIPARRRRRG